ncbi:hypothetical protein [Streptococcus uberis]|uniref:hypothetical protein n=1 Tax=Streptococcus uberis TaxID=1349 RepID=UPI0038B4E022
MNKKILSAIIVLSISLAGCSNTKFNSSVNQNSNDYQYSAIGKTLNDNKKTIWYHTTDGANKDAIIDTVYVAQAGKVTSYKVVDVSTESNDEFTLGNISTLNNEQIIKKAKEQNKKISRSQLDGIISTMEKMINSTEISLQNSSSFVDGNYSETLTNTGGQKTKDQIISETKNGISEAKNKIEELKTMNTEKHEMFHRTPISININLKTDSSGNNVQNETITITNTVFNSNYYYSNLRFIGNYFFNEDKMVLNSPINFDIYKGHYSGFTINNSPDDLFITKTKTSKYYFKFDNIESKLKNTKID